MAIFPFLMNKSMCNQIIVGGSCCKQLVQIYAPKRLHKIFLEDFYTTICQKRSTGLLFGKCFHSL